MEFICLVPLSTSLISIEGVHNKFLSYASFILKIEHPSREYSSTQYVFNIQTQVFRRHIADVSS